MTTTLRITADGIRRLVNKLGENRLTGRLLPYTQLEIPAQQWEEQYADGHWQRLEKIHELPRYGAVAAYCREAAPGPRLLDIGCGEGLLLRHLPADHQPHYLGLDISINAIERAQTQFPRARFQTADVNHFEPDEPFDTVVFNECIYYFNNPVAVVGRYMEMLTPDGLVIVSCYDSPRTRKVWKRLDRHFELVDATHIRNRGSTSWTIKLYAHGPARFQP